VNGYIGHTPAIAWLKMNDGFQIAAVQISSLKGGEVPFAAVDGQI
jgi:hypothetical protein